MLMFRALPPLILLACSKSLATSFRPCPVARLAAAIISMLVATSASSLARSLGSSRKAAKRADSSASASSNSSLCRTGFPTLAPNALRALDIFNALRLLVTSIAIVSTFLSL